MLVLGGINLDEPSKKSTDLPLMQLDFTSNSGLFESIASKKAEDAD